MKYSKLILLLTWIIIGLQNNIQAQSKMQSSVMGNGCKSVYGNNIQINSTLGQPIIGIVNNSNNTGYFGFWYQTDKNTTTDLEKSLTDLLPRAYSLEQNYPNPFNPTTFIKYSIPDQSSVMLKIYDLLGKEVAVLINEKQSAGNYKVLFNAKDLPSGVYFYRITSENFTLTKKMLLLE